MTTEPPKGVDTIPGAVYFFLDGEEGPFLVPVARAVDRGLPATTAVAALLAGPSGAEQSGIPAISSTVPDGTRLNSISIADRVATVDLSAEFVSGGGSASMRGRLAQVVFTLTRFETVDGVVFLVDGQPTEVFGGEGVIVDVPATRAGFEDLLPAIMVESPPFGGAAGNPARVTGTANTFEAVFQVVLTDSEGLILYDSYTMATCGSGCRGDFDVTIPYDVAETQVGALIVFEFSAEDGRQINIREYPVGLSPAG
jgi:hypothetical protein